jgi:hypothetical protein
VTTSSWGKRATSSARLAILLAALCAACGASHAAGDPPPGASTLATDPEIEFEFDSLDARPVSAAAMRGKPTVIAFVTTDSLAGQAQVDFLVAMAKHDAARVNYAVVAIGVDRELAQLYAKSLSLTFPVAILDPGKAGATAFGDLSVVPVTVLLDPGGHVTWRAQARVARADEIRRVIMLVH